MAVTPRTLRLLALERHRQPWNWTLHASAVVLFAATLLMHSPLLLATTLIGFGVGFLNIDVPVSDNRWFRFQAAAVEWEKNWMAAPWNWPKWWRFLVVCAIAALTIWALWIREPATLGLLIGFGILARIVWENRQAGIKP